MKFLITFIILVGLVFISKILFFQICQLKENLKKDIEIKK
jgi:hypothetical protein